MRRLGVGLALSPLRLRDSRACTLREWVQTGLKGAEVVRSILTSEQLAHEVGSRWEWKGSGWKMQRKERKCAGRG